MDDYIPTAGDVRIAYMMHQNAHWRFQAERGERFNRWLAEVVRAAKHDGWVEGFDAGERDAMGHVTFDEPCIKNPYEKEQ